MRWMGFKVGVGNVSLVRLVLLVGLLPWRGGSWWCRVSTSAYRTVESVKHFRFSRRPTRTLADGLFEPANLTGPKQLPSGPYLPFRLPPPSTRAWPACRPHNIAPPPGLHSGLPGKLIGKPLPHFLSQQDGAAHRSLIMPVIQTFRLNKAGKYLFLAWLCGAGKSSCLPTIRD